LGDIYDLVIPGRRRGNLVPDEAPHPEGGSRLKGGNDEKTLQSSFPGEDPGTLVRIKRHIRMEVPASRAGMTRIKR